MQEVRILLCFLPLFFFCDIGLGQELKTWTNKAGKSVEGVFFEFDDKAESVTILVPKRVLLSNLDDATIALVKSEANKPKKDKLKDAEIPRSKPSERTVVLLLDPRIVQTTKNTLATNYGNDKTDIIASKTLSQSESRMLWSKLNEELEDNTDVPFCGHFPAYAVQHYRADKLVSSTTVCGLCMTWARKDEFKALKGKESIVMLSNLIPLPDVFAEKSVPDLIEMKKKPVLSFHELDSER